MPPSIIKGTKTTGNKGNNFILVEKTLSFNRLKRKKTERIKKPA